MTAHTPPKENTLRIVSTMVWLPNSRLVGGFNPSEKYLSDCKSSLNRGEDHKNVWNHTFIHTFIMSYEASSRAQQQPLSSALPFSNPTRNVWNPPPSRVDYGFTNSRVAPGISWKSWRSPTPPMNRQSSTSIIIPFIRFILIFQKAAPG